MLRLYRYVVILLTPVLIRIDCHGQRIPTKVTYKSVTNHADIAGASSQRGNQFYKVLYIDETPDPDVLVVGERNYVRTYDITDVSTIQNGESNLVLVPVSGGALGCSNIWGSQASVECHNFINVIKEYDNKWYYCGTSGINPQCWICEDRTCSVAERTSSFEAVGFVTRNRQVDQPLLISAGRVFGAAASNANSDSGHAIVHGDILADGIFDQNDDQTIATDNDNPDWINEPAFVGDPIVYSDDGSAETHTYFFYRETATEYINAGKAVYSRVARVCNDDEGGDSGTLLDGKFTTFLKARLNCSIPSLFPFNYDFLQDIYRSTTDDNVIYATFTNNPQIGRANSAICVYRMDEIAAVFKNSKFKGQVRPSTLWLPATDSNVPDPRPGTCPTYTDDTVYSFIAGYVLMDQSVPNKQDYTGTASLFNRDSDPPLMVLDGLYVTEMVVDEGVTDAARQTHDVFFLGTNDGKVYKAYVQGLGTDDAQTRIVDEIDLGISGSSDDEAVLSMVLYSDTNTNTKTIFVGTASSLHEIPLQHCSDQMTEIDCITVQDPYCVWSAGDSCEASTTGDQCLDNDVYSCGTWPVPECFDPTTLETTACTQPIPACVSCCGTSNCQLPECDPSDCQPDHVRVLAADADSESMVRVNAYVRVEQNSVWGETTFACSCGCPPVDVQETTDSALVESTMEYLFGVYVFDMSSCTEDVDITFKFVANSNQIEKVVSVAVDTEPLETDSDALQMVSDMDKQLAAYYYQVRLWNKIKNDQPLRKAQSVYCYNCGSSP